MQKKMMIIAGETSGDRHAADLVYELNELDPGIEWVGIGGEALRQSGTRLLFHLSQLAFLGITEVIGHLPFIRKVFKAVKNELRNGVDAIILVDYPGFNLRIARIANRINIPVIYYISPQLWAWGEKRVEKMRRYVDLLLVVFQFEETYYNKFGITAHFVGHPLIDQIKINHNEDQFRRHNQIPLEKPILGLFPGSREMEVRKLLPTMVRAAQVLKHKYDCIPAIGCSSHLPRSLYERIVPQADIQLIESQTHALMNYAHAAIVASGTATLELGYLQTPMVVVYSVSPISYWLGKKLVKIKNLALANIVLGETVVPELIQKDISVRNINNLLEHYFADPIYYQSVKRKLGEIKRILGQSGASQRAADLILAFMDNNFTKIAG